MLQRRQVPPNAHPLATRWHYGSQLHQTRQSSPWGSCQAPTQNITPIVSFTDEGSHPSAPNIEHEQSPFALSTLLKQHMTLGPTCTIAPASDHATMYLPYHPLYSNSKKSTLTSIHHTNNLIGAVTFCSVRTLGLNCSNNSPLPALHSTTT